MELHRSPTPRNGDRRAGERRNPERAGPGRRRGERRKSTARAGLLMAVLSLLSGGRILLRPTVETSTDDFRVAPDAPEMKTEETDPSRFDAIIAEASALYRVNSALVKAGIH